jgi:hypothetical protein
MTQLHSTCNSPTSMSCCAWRSCARTVLATACAWRTCAPATASFAIVCLWCAAILASVSLAFSAFLTRSARSFSSSMQQYKLPAFASKL